MGAGPDGIVLFLAMAGALLGAFVVFPMLLYLKGKPMQEVEDVLEDGRYFFSGVTMFAGHGALHYASIFLFEWYARRYKMLKKRELVRSSLVRWFKVYYILFMLTVSLMFVPSIWIYLAE